MMHRVSAIAFDFAVFTNLSSDHVSQNEHHSFEEYMMCKKKLFHMCQVAIMNCDDPYYQDMIKDLNCEIQTYGLHHVCDLQAKHLSFYRKDHQLGVYFQTSGKIQDDFQINVPGEFSVYNALVAILVCHQLKMDKKCIKEGLTHIHIRGRNEIVPVKANYTVMIDYAHNAYAFDCLLKTITQYHPRRIICVYGAGGQRDRKRRYESGKVVASYQAYSLLTADNPRGENVLDICHDIILGIESAKGEYKVIEDRQQAICYALSIAQDDDIVLCLGKGHEDYQIIDQTPLPFSERKIIEEYFHQ